MKTEIKETQLIINAVNPGRQLYVHPCRCGWLWASYNDHPAVCPHCKSPRWDKVRTGNEPGPKPKERKADE